MDVHTPERRSHNMSRIRSRNTGPELTLRRALHARGLRYRLHDKGLPGSPDIVFGPRRAVIFVHGCFWHGHQCPMFRLPATRSEFWRQKISGNVERDGRALEELSRTGWRVLIVWECALRGRRRLDPDHVASLAAAFIGGDEPLGTIEGDWGADTETGPADRCGRNGTATRIARSPPERTDQ